VFDHGVTCAPAVSGRSTSAFAVVPIEVPTMPVISDEEKSSCPSSVMRGCASP
jgi:hypothetical protein